MRYEGRAGEVGDPSISGEKLLIQATESPPPGWDDFVGRAKEGTFCHLAGWIPLMSDVMGHRCLCLVARSSDGAWHGVLPLVRVDSRLFGRYLVSMPFLSYGGPVGKPDAQAVLAQWAVEEARLSGADLLELRSRHEVACGLSPSYRKITVVLELADTVEKQWEETIPATRRRQIRRAQQEDFRPSFGFDHLEAFYEVFAKNMRNLGTPVLPFRWFERVSKSFSDSALLGVVYAGEGPVAAGCGFVWRDEFELTWVSSLREERNRYPNMLLYWAFMEEMIRRGIRVFNFGRCTPGGLTHRFKHQWGAKDVPLPWPQWSGRGVDSTPSPERPIYRLATAVWQRVPLPLANRLGPVLARYLP